MTTTPKVQDFTDGDRAPKIDVDPSTVNELLLRLFVFTGGENQSEDEWEAGPGWFDKIRDNASTQLQDRIADLGHSGWVWLTLIGLAQRGGATSSVEQFSAHLRSLDPAELRRALLMGCLDTREIATAGVLVDTALDGDAEALDRLLETEEATTSRHPALRNLLAQDPERITKTLADIIDGFHEETFLAEETRICGVLDLDAEQKRAMAGTVTPERLVELATNGVTFTPQPNLNKVLLIPSVIIRPWVVISDFGSSRAFCYPVADEYLAADPDAPPTWLLQLLKALADERRLRMLKLLADSDASLTGLAEALGITKSTAHHHLRILRAAGLIRVTLGRERPHSLRIDSLPEASRMLAAYLVRSPT